MGEQEQLMAGLQFLISKGIHLRTITESDLEGPYLTWFNDAEVCRENMHHVYPYTPENAKSYIQEANRDRHRLVLAIIRSKDDKHIGNSVQGREDNW